ncbi:type VII secretion integral membrane protein EccD [Micromonospora sp. NBC_01813]|uniref:type VII secretion integral membrane protein EccD n=1 Tax=Micromonospora sp. NBC_01813 TaxID=2975988 RepID=UPI002DDBC0B8|nr:type VII secretion integral membrane protein EccD [Micromonospora sp. NBC_01813]WSA07154.1 type VII secretion integral membrane protein EccD [Micromonospora sp. NBC_01813]
MAFVVTDAPVDTGAGHATAATATMSATMSAGTAGADGPPASARRCPVTIVGARHRVDLALPVDVPVGEYIGLLLELCRQPTTESVPQVWSLAPLGRRPLPLDARLADYEPTEGLVLYLADLAADEAYEPQVTEIDDLVADATDELARWRWNQRVAAGTLVAAGVAWLVATMILLTVGPTRPPGTPLFVLTAGLAVPALAAVARWRRWPLPESVLAGLALAAPVCLACAGWLGLGSVSGAMVAACVGGVLSFAAVRCAATLAAALWIAVAAACAAPLAVVAASEVRVLSVVALVGYALLVAAPAAASRLALLQPAGQAAPVRPDDPRTVAATVRRAYRILSGWTAAAALLTAVGLVGLARSGDLAAWLLVGALAAALVLRAVSYEFAVEAVSAVVAAAAGLVALAVTVGADWPGAIGVSMGVALVLVAAGGWLLSRSPFADRRPRWLLAASMFCTALALVAALAVWGVVGGMLDLGRSMA